MFRKVNAWLPAGCSSGKHLRGSAKLVGAISLLGNRLASDEGTSEHSIPRIYTTERWFTWYGVTFMASQHAGCNETHIVANKQTQPDCGQLQTLHESPIT